MKRTIYGLFVLALLITGSVLANDYYNHSGIPATGSPGSSAQMRAEFSAIESGFSSLPNLTGNAGKAVVVDGGGTALTVTTGGLTLGGNLTISGAFATTLTVTNTTTLTLPLTGTLATLAGSETLTTKTINLTSNTLTGTKAQFNTAMSDGDFATLAGSESLTNKSLTSPTLTGTPIIPISTGYFQPVAGVQMNGAINGLTYGIDGGDTTNDLFVQIGGAQDITNRQWMQIDTAITKRSDATWVVGSNQGGLDTGVVGNNDYFIWLIMRPDTGVVDVLFSLSASSPTMPTNYTRSRLIGWFRRTAGATVNFIAEETAGGGLEYRWVTPILSVDLTNTLTSTQRSDNLDVPNNATVDAHITVFGADSTIFQAILQGIDVTNAAPSVSISPGFNFGNHVTGVIAHESLTVRVQGRALGSRASVATVDTYRIVTKGFTWSRRST